MERIREPLDKEVDSESCIVRISVSCSEGTRVKELCIPDSVRELCDRCFKGCRSLLAVTLGSSSHLERIGVKCFTGSNLITT